MNTEEFFEVTMRKCNCLLLGWPIPDRILLRVGLFSPINRVCTANGATTRTRVRESHRTRLSWAEWNAKGCRERYSEGEQLEGLKLLFSHESRSIGRTAAAESSESSRIRARAASSKGPNPSVYVA